MNRSLTTRLGLIIAGVLGLADIASIGAIGADDGPPPVVVLLGVTLGLATLVAVVSGWRGSRTAVVTVIALRAVSALTAVPAFFVDSAGSGFVALAAMGISLTVIAVLLLLPAMRDTRVAA